MTLVAHPFPLPALSAGSAALTALAEAGFAELDDRVVALAGGVVVVQTPSAAVAQAVGAHVARRALRAGAFVIRGRARPGAPLWSEVGSVLGLATLPGDPAEAARAIARAAGPERAAVVARLPESRGWDRAVTLHLSALSAAPTVVLLAVDGDPAEDLGAEVYEVGASLDPACRQRWWAALAEAAAGNVSTDAIAGLDGWWESARRAAPTRVDDVALDAAAGDLLGTLALASRAWPVAEVGALVAAGAGGEALVRAGAATVTGGWLAVEPSWDARAEALAGRLGPEVVLAVARALASRFDHDAWAMARAAELFARAGRLEEAGEAHARAMGTAGDGTSRGELMARWMAVVSALPEGEQLPLRVQATERALAVGQAEEAFRWAQSAAFLAPDDPGLALIFGRAAVALGDLVAARVALERAARHASSDGERAVVAAEMAEVAYLSGELGVAAREAEHALALDGGAGPSLRARNTQGKLLLAASRWDEADRHFAADAWAATAAGLPTEELRARLNRGIALLSKGLADDARAVFEAVLDEAERSGDARACAFAVENLAVVATLRHDYARALELTERTLKLRERIGDRLKTALVLTNLAELRRRLGLIEHAEHAVSFGRRVLGPGMPPAHSAFFSLQAARNALLRGNTIEARREVTRALSESEAAGLRNYISEACCVSARVALEDGDLARAGGLLDRAAADAQTPELRAEAMLVAAVHARCSGSECETLASEALAASRASGKEDLVIEALILLAEIHAADERVDTARAHVDAAAALRDQIAASLPPAVRAAFVSRPDFGALGRLQAALGEVSASVSQPELVPASNPSRPSSRPAAPSAPREMVGDDPAVRGLLAAVRKIARSNSTVLVRGESGTGKELVAEAIHRASDRAGGPMVTVNCAALVETLLLSELFGHEKGAFTGASARRRGRFEVAEGGTLFLDEIGDISARTQVALLRVLQEKTFERVGGLAPIHANVRVICATHRDLRAMVDRGEFREDLYYRLRGITLEVPPLRARLGDLPRLSEHLLARISGERGEPQKRLSPDALDLLGRHRWPGNVRELENALRAASLFCEDDVITAAVLAENVDDLRAAAQGRARTPALAPASSARDVLADDGDLDPAALEPLPAGEACATDVAYTQVRGGATSLPDLKRQIERDCIARALAETKGNITRAATLLGMKRPRLSQLVKQYGLAAVSSEGL